MTLDTTTPVPPTRPSKPETTLVRCLGHCGRMFKSLDPIRNRICKRCNDCNSAMSRRIAHGPSKAAAPIPFDPRSD